jgi:hypothetical protein
MAALFRRKALVDLFGGPYVRPRHQEVAIE